MSIRWSRGVCAETDFVSSDFVELVNDQSLNGLNLIWISELL